MSQALPPVPAMQPYHLDRQAVSRAIGAKNRRVGGAYDDRTNDGHAARAEEWVCRLFGVPFNAGLDGPDPGWDFLWAGMKTDVKWTPHRSGKLLLPAWKVGQAEAFVGVFGPMDDRPQIGGWAFLWDFPEAVDETLPVPAYTLRKSELRPIDDLLALGRDDA